MDFIAAVETTTRHMRNADRALEAGDIDRAAHLAGLAAKSHQRSLDALAGDAPELADEIIRNFAAFEQRHLAAA